MALSKTCNNNRLNKGLTEYDLACNIKGSIRSTLFRLPDEVGAGSLPERGSVAEAGTTLVILSVCSNNKRLDPSKKLMVGGCGNHKNFGQG